MAVRTFVIREYKVAYCPLMCLGIRLARLSSIRAPYFRCARPSLAVLHSSHIHASAAAESGYRRLLRPLPLRLPPLPLPRPLPILTGFKPVTFSASNADRTDSAFKAACAFPEAFARSTSSRAFCMASALHCFCCAASSTRDCSTQARHRDFPSPLFH